MTTDNNTALLLYLAEVNQSFNLSLVEYNNFEAGEGKTVLDTHFAHISHKIVQWVRVLQSGEHLGELIGVRASTNGNYNILHLYTTLWSFFLIEITSNHPFKNAFNGFHLGIFKKHICTVCFTTFILKHLGRHTRNELVLIYLCFI